LFVPRHVFGFAWIVVVVVVVVVVIVVVVAAAATVSANGVADVRNSRGGSGLEWVPVSVRRIALVVVIGCRTFASAPPLQGFLVASGPRRKDWIPSAHRRLGRMPPLLDAWRIVTSMLQLLKCICTVLLVAATTQKNYYRNKKGGK
jgi:NADH:ubiquinone oxidoreductase subunit 3 (subunit A)